MNRLVQLSVNTPSPSSDLKVRVYYPVRLLTGPDLQIIRTYDDYLRFYGEDSFAQLLFNWNYELLCHRVSYVDSKANLTKYKIEGEYKYYQDTGEYINSTLIESRSRKQTHINSFLVTINDKAESYNNFYLIFRTKVENIDTENIFGYSIGLFGCDYITNQGEGVYENGKDKIKNDFNLEPISKSVFLPSFHISEEGYEDAHLTLETFKPTLKQFFIDCGLTVEDLGYNRLLVSTASEESSYSLYSDVVSFEELEDHYDRYYASTYKDCRILSISSKYKSADSNIKVNIEELDTGSYSVHVSKSSGDWINEEYFIVDPRSEGTSTNTVRTFEEINVLSDYIEITTYKTLENESDWDPTGSYELKGSFGFNDTNLYLNKLAILVEDVVDGYYSGGNFYTDIELLNRIDPEVTKVYYDLSELTYYVWDGIQYLSVDYVEYDPPQCDVAIPLVNDIRISRELGKVFTQALIVIGPSEPVNNGIRVNPDKVYWYDYQESIPSGFAILDLLMTTSYYNDATLFRLPEENIIVPEDRYDLRIIKSDYGVEVKSVYVYESGKDFRYTNRAFLARAMIYRICMDISGITMEEINTYLNDQCSQVADLFNLDLSYELKNEKQSGRTYTADLMILVDNRLFAKFDIYTELNYEG